MTFKVNDTLCINCRIKLKFLLVLALLIPVLSCTQKEKKNRIHGRIINAEKSWVYLQKITEEGDVTIDSVRCSNDGSFEMANPATSVDFFILRTDPTNVIFLILKPNENIEITGNSKKLEQTYKVRGSKDSELIQKLRTYDQALSDSLNKVYELKRAEDPVRKDEIGLNLQQLYTTRMENFSKQFISDNISSLVSLSATKFINQQAELILMNKLKDSLANKYPDNKYVQDYIILVSNLNKLPPGSACPEIELKTPDNKTLRLSSLKGKVVLIDFWASWCSPCRRENPTLVKLYEKYKGPDFEIFGVSLDENVAAWKNAIDKDGITWPQVSDLKRWESKVVKEFHIEAIPYNVLIDREGKIIAKGIRSEELELKIMEITGKSL
jgi:thiol-disulfide isomerase/thioredoxin